MNSPEELFKMRLKTLNPHHLKNGGKALIARWLSKVFLGSTQKG